MIRNLNYLVFVVTFLWAGMDLIAWHHPQPGLLLAAVCAASGVLMRCLYLRAEGARDREGKS